MLRRSAELCSKYAEGSYTGRVDLDIIRLCAAHIDLYDLYEQECLRPSRLGVERHADPRVQGAWALLWDKMHLAVQKYWDTRGWAEIQPHHLFSNTLDVPRITDEEAFAEDRSLAHYCLQRMPALDLATASVQSSQSDPDSAGQYQGLYSIFPLKLYLALSLFSAGKTEGTWFIRQAPPEAEPASSEGVPSVVEESEGAHNRWCWCQVCEDFAFSQTPVTT